MGVNTEQEKIEEIAALIKQVRFGEVIITIHDSEIVEVQKNERKRFKAQKRLPAQS
ncbi:MAG: YezD family protein [Candidatus Omnitrophica bacterium]|nr:YezD family protein [Candidatus Omnitrophota bacterium]